MGSLPGFDQHPCSKLSDETVVDSDIVAVVLAVALVAAAVDSGSAVVQEE